MTHEATKYRELCAQICTGKERPRQNDARKNGTCQTRPGRQASTRKITVSGALMANVRLMLVRLWESRHKGSRRQAYPQPAAQPPAASAVVVVAVVVELGPEARTGSRRSMLTDDSRPNRQLTTKGPLQQVAQVFLYGKVKTPSK